MSQIIHRLDVIGGENLKIKTNIGNIEKELQLQADKIVVAFDLLVKVQEQTNEFLQKTSFSKYLKNSQLPLLYNWVKINIQSSKPS